MPQTILVVDDSMLIRHTVCRYLEENGFSVESATNGAEALEMLNSFTPEIIITDLQMPRMNGPQFIDALKARPQTAGIPIVVLSAKRSTAEMNTDNRADYVIFKDIEITVQLHRALESILHRPVTSV